MVEKVPEDVLTEEGKGKQSQGVFEERRDCHIVYLNWKGLPVSGMSSQFRERYRTARHHGTGKVNRGEVMVGIFGEKSLTLTFLNFLLLSWLCCPDVVVP